MQRILVSRCIPGLPVRWTRFLKEGGGKARRSSWQGVVVMKTHAIGTCGFFWLGMLLWVLSACTHYQNKPESNNQQNNQQNNSNNFNNNYNNLDVISEQVLVDSRKLEGKKIYNSRLVYGRDGYLHAFIIASDLDNPILDWARGTITLFRFLSVDGGTTWQELPALEDFPITFTMFTVMSGFLCPLQLQDALHLFPYIEANGTTLVALHDNLYVFWQYYEAEPQIIQTTYADTHMFYYDFHCFEPTMTYKIYNMIPTNSALRGIFKLSDSVNSSLEYAFRVALGNFTAYSGIDLEECDHELDIGFMERFPPELPLAYANDLPMPMRALVAESSDGGVFLLARNRFPYFKDKFCNIDTAIYELLTPSWRNYAPVWYVSKFQNDHWQMPRRIESDFLKEFRLTMNPRQQYQPPDPDSGWYWHQLALLDMKADAQDRVYVLAGLFRDQPGDAPTGMFPLLFRIDYDPADEDATSSRMELVYTFPEPAVRFAQENQGKILITGSRRAYLYDPQTGKTGLWRDPCPLDIDETACGDLRHDATQARIIIYRKRPLPEMEARIQLAPSKARIPFTTTLSAEVALGGESRPWQIDFYRNVYLQEHETYDSASFPEGVSLEVATEGHYLVGAVVRPQGEDAENLPEHAQLFYVHAFGATFDESLTSRVRGAPFRMDEKYLYTLDARDNTYTSYNKLHFYEIEDDEWHLAYTHEFNPPWASGSDRLQLLQIRPYPEGVVLLWTACDEHDCYASQFDFIRTAGATPELERSFTFRKNVDGIYCSGFDLNDEILACMQPLEYVRFFNPHTLEPLGIINIGGVVDASLDLLENNYVMVRQGGWLHFIDPGDLVSGHSGPLSYFSLMMTDDTSLPFPVVGVPNEYGAQAIEGNRVLFCFAKTSYKWVDFTDPMHPIIVEEFELVNDYAALLSKCYYDDNKVWCIQADNIYCDRTAPPQCVSNILVYDLSQTIEVFHPGLNRAVSSKKKILHYRAHDLDLISDIFSFGDTVYVRDNHQYDPGDSLPYWNSRIFRLLH